MNIKHISWSASPVIASEAMRKKADADYIFFNIFRMVLDYVFLPLLISWIEKKLFRLYRLFP